jgi:hypothetical protein
MRHIWIVGSIFLGGCVARVSNAPPPVATTAQPVVLVPVEEHTHHPQGGPPGQDPSFVPPGHGGVPPGQAKKTAAIEGIGDASASPVLSDSSQEEEKPKENEKGKKKVKAKVKKNK